MKTGWYNDNNVFFVVKPLHNGNRQSLIVGAQQLATNKWNIFMGIFSSNATYNSIMRSSVWMAPTSTNKKPAAKNLFLALEALDEIEQEIYNHANGEAAIIYVDGIDERRLRVYTKVLTKKRGYRESPIKSEYVSNMQKLYKMI